ncbi:MAG: tetratricopeptide repeat protein [Caldilineaceae bacterium]|nr:tetratricopeptide repeat protein [Caldilineaceae bacterium]
MTTQPTPQPVPRPMNEALRRALNESARLLQQNRPGEALEFLEPFLAAAVDYPDVAINVSGAYILQRKWDQAVKVLEKAAQEHPENVMIWTNLAAARLGRLEVAGPKQQERAIHAYQRALALDPRAHNVHYALGLIYKERGEIMRACAFFQRAIEVNPTDADARMWLNRLDQLLAESRAAQDEDAAASNTGTSGDTGTSDSGDDE